MPKFLRRESFTYGSLCSGIEAASVAWEPLGWTPAFFSEIEPFPSAVLAHHWPDVPNLGDMTKHKDWNPNAKIDLLVGGTPCQAFSVAGLRKGLEDSRGNLTLTFIDIADQFDPDWIVWENVPGVLSSKDNAFGCFLGGLAGEDEALLPPGDKWANAGCVFGPKRTIAWRVLDAQYFGVAQRRRRVFVVASPRHRGGPRAVLFEREGVRRDTPPSREKGEGAAGTLAARTRGGGGLGTDMDLAGSVVGVQASQSGVRFNETVGTLDANYGSRRHNGVMVPTFWNGEQVTQTLDAVLATGQTMPEKNRFPAVLVPSCLNGISEYNASLPTLRAKGGDCAGGSEALLSGPTHSLCGEGFDASEDGTGRGTPLVPVAYRVHGEHSTAMQGGGIARVADPVEVARCLDSCGGYATNQGGNVVAQPVAYDDRNQAAMENLHHTLRADGIGSGVGDAVAYSEAAQTSTAGIGFDYNDEKKAASHLIGSAMQVRRLLPVECERLQGFPDDHTMIPSKFVLKLGIQPDPDNPKHWAADGPRYKAIGNSMATPCMYFIGSRIKRFMEGTL